MKPVSINIVNWNGLKFIRDCIESIKIQTYKNIEINIVDNNSSDGSVEFIRNNFPDIRLVVNAQNEGFSKAHNQAIRMSSGDYIIPLNFDITLSSSFVEEMVKAVETSSDTGIVSGKLYIKTKHRTNILDSTGITMQGMFPADRGQYETDSGQFNDLEHVFGASGATPLFRREMLDDIKLNDEYFDEDFFIYVEDVDLCWRSQLYGWKALYTPSAIAYHCRGATRESNAKMKKDYVLIGNRNRYLTIIKNAFLSNLLKNIIWILILETGLYLRQLINGNFYILKVPVMVLKKISIALSKRAIIQKRKKVSSGYMETFFFHDIGRVVKKRIANTVFQRGC